MSDKLTPPPCPECGNDAKGPPGHGVRVEREGLMGMEKYQVLCSCGFEGPKKDDRPSAVIAWSDL